MTERISITIAKNLNLEKNCSIDLKYAAKLASKMKTKPS